MPGAVAVSRTDGAARIACLAILAALPVVAVFSSRSGVAVITLAAVAAALASAAEGRARQDLAQVLRALATPTGLAALAFLAWALASTAWSPFPALSLRSLGEFVLPLAAALWLAVTLPGRIGRPAVLAMAAGVAVAALLILGELASGVGLRDALGLRAVTYIFNRPVLTALVLALPLAVLTAREIGGGAGLAAALGLLALVGAAILRSESGAAVLAGAVALAAYAAARVAPRAALWAAGLVLAVSFLGAPLMGGIADRAISARVHDQLTSTSSRARIEIWKVFSEAAMQRPLTGSGFGTSPRAAETPAAAGVTSPQAKLLAVGHPHNAPLQIWTELGAVGIALALAVLGLALKSVGAHAPRARAPILALGAAVVAVSLVGHGAWQGWWPAAIGVAAVLFRHALLTQPGSPRHE